MRVKNKCELCSNICTIYCESDKARLCFECDSKVHGANFLVAKHTRTLLCKFCQSLTLWSGSGPRLGPTAMSVCQSCNNSANNVEMLRGDVHAEDDRSSGDRDDYDNTDDGDEEESDEEDDDHGFEYDEDEDEDEDGYDDDEEDNQVVPWSYSSSNPR